MSAVVDEMSLVQKKMYAQAEHDEESNDWIVADHSSMLKATRILVLWYYGRKIFAFNFIGLKLLRRGIHPCWVSYCINSVSFPLFNVAGRVFAHCKDKYKFMEKSMMMLFLNVL